jgi:hypothetical protein
LALMADDPWLRGDWMQTYSGRRFYPLDPRAEELADLDIAHALSLLCRYGGHVERFYSVAEHCVEADNRILLTERTALMPRAERWSQDDEYEPLRVRITGWPPQEAEQAYKRRLLELT